MVSDVLSGLIFILLGIHFVNELLWRRGQAKNPIFRVHGRHFMLQGSTVFHILGFCSYHHDRDFIYRYDRSGRADIFQTRMYGQYMCEFKTYLWVQEGWTYLDGVYFIMVTFLTSGWNALIHSSF